MKPAKPRKASPTPSPRSGPKAARAPRQAAEAPGDPPATPRRTQLEKELRSAIAQVDEKGLLFLLRQAQVLLHNARVERMQSSEPESDLTGPLPIVDSRPDTVLIEKAEGGKAIFLTLGRVRKVMAPEEMKRLVRICYGAGTRSEAVRQLFTVLVRERKDILTDAKIGSPDSPLIIGLFNAVRETYRLEDR
jgi:hypothetical protein